jgi:hypothetical protein
MAQIFANQQEGNVFLKKRTKLVSFRLSEEEYEQLSRACMATGARSISDFARTALQQSVSAEGGVIHVNGTGGTRELIDRMKDLTHRFEQFVGSAQLNQNTEI